jgi:hypothetical protein
LKLLFIQLSPQALTILPLYCKENTDQPVLGLVVRDVDAQEAQNGMLRITLLASNGTFLIDESKREKEFYLSNSLSTLSPMQYFNAPQNASKSFQLLISALDKNTALEGNTLITIICL